MFKVGVGQAKDIDTLKATRAAIARSRIHLDEIQPQAGQGNRLPLAKSR